MEVYDFAIIEEAQLIINDTGGPAVFRGSIMHLLNWVVIIQKRRFYVFRLKIKF
jgi:hypothetical protein